MGKRSFTLAALIGILGLLIGLIVFINGGSHRTELNSSSRTLPKPLQLLPEKVEVKIPMARVIPVLLYHYVEYVTDERDTDRKSLNVEPHILEQQIKDMKAAGYQFITPKDLPRVLLDRSTSRYIMLTFDDGNRSFYDQTYPVLKRQNVPAVNYLIAGMLNQPNYLFGWQVKEMAPDGLVEFGLHGYNHQEATSLAPTDFAKALENGSSIIEELTGMAPTAYAYPYGRNNESTLKTLKASTITSAMTTEKGLLIEPDKLFLIPRIKPGRLTGPSLLSILR